MPRPLDSRRDADRERQEMRGLADPDRTDWQIAHDEHLDAQDRLAELGPAGVHVEAPSDRERREHFDETKARNTLRPRTGHVQVQPRNVPVCTCDAGVSGRIHLRECPASLRNAA